MLSLLLALLASFPAYQAAGAAPASQETPAWDELAAEYERAFEVWAAQLSRSGGWEQPESERPPGPAGAFWPRFEALAEKGEGRAVLWQLDNASSAGGDVAGVWRRLFERVRRAGDAVWVASALPRLSTQGIESELLALLDGLQAESKPRTLRVSARLVQANLVQTSEPLRAADLRVRAAFVEYRDFELGAGAELGDEDTAELGDAVIDGLEKAQRGHFEHAYYECPDGTYYPHVAGPVDPVALWKPVIQTLAENGCARARFWALTNSDWQVEPAEQERQRGYLDALCQEPMPEEWLVSLGYEVGGLAYRLGLDFVEPRVRALVDKSAEASRPRLLFGLGDALCESAKDDVARARGMALLRDVAERWPTSEAAKSAAGKLFRYTNLIVGKKVPDFDTVDADGNAFKLSDYEGKVTVIDFWGFW